MFNILYSRGPFVVYSYSVLYGLAACVFLVLSIWTGRRRVPDCATTRILDWSMGFLITFNVLSRLGSFVYEKAAGLQSAAAFDLSASGRAVHMAAFAMWVLCLVTPRRAGALGRLWECWAGPALLASGIGYMGCYAYGCCYGCIVSDSHPLGVRYQIRHNDVGAIIGAPALVGQMKSGQLPFAAVRSRTVHPVQLYHSALLCAGGAVILCATAKFCWRGWFPLSVTYYMAVRWWLDSFRGDHVGAAAIYSNAPQVRLAMLTIMCLTLLVIVFFDARSRQRAGRRT